MATCSECLFDIPNNARVCGHCGAQQSYIAHDTSWDGRIGGIRQGALWGAGVGAVLALLLGYNFVTGAFWLGLVGAALGFIKGREVRVEPDP